MALLFTILCGLAALSLGYFINYFTKGHFIESTATALDAEVRYIEAIGPDNVPPETENQIYIFLKDDGTLPKDATNKVNKLTEGIVVFDHLTNGKKYAAKIHTLPDGRKILIGENITRVSNDFKFMQWLGVASIIFVMLVVFVSYIISIFVVGGTNKIAQTAQDIIRTGDLSRRVEVGSRWDDLSNMAAVLNLLLDRIEELMQGVRQVSDNIAHDLRTPLTRLRNHMEELKDTKTKDELLEEADHLLDTFNALLRISRIEAEKRRSQFQDMSISDVLSDAAAFYEPLAEEKGVKLESDIKDAQLWGDKDLLFQLFANLIDNSLKFTPSGGVISVSLNKNEKDIEVIVADSGTGVSNDQKEKIFTRFYRTDSSRNSSGTGLGLSMAKAIVQLHNGKISAEDNNPGLKIVTIL